MSTSAKLGIMILAAGSSSRLGQPKQLLSYRDKSLLNNTIEEAKKVKDARVVVILGDNNNAIAAHITEQDVKVIYNTDWKEGMGSSIRNGLIALLREQSQLEGVILTVCDQPFLTAALLNTLISTAKTTGKQIISSAYNGTLGTPVLFMKNYFSDLAVLNGKEGAKLLLEKYSDDVSTVPFENGDFDIDTPEDYNRLISKQHDKGFFQPDT